MAKKFTKVLCALLAFVMCLGTVPAFAIEATPELTAEEKAAQWPIKKTATGLDENDQTDVSLTVPGVVEGNIDVVFILGGGMTENMETIESAINVFKPAMESGKATVRMGLISLEKGEEIILDLNSDEAVLDPATYVDFVYEKFESINDLPYGSTNLHSQLVEAQKMLAAETTAKPENKYLFVMATGRTYWYDNEQGDATMIISEDYDKTNKRNRYFWGIKAYQVNRGGNSNLYLIPAQYKDNYDEYWKDVEKWVTDDIKNGDKYAYTALGSKDNANWYNEWCAQNDGGSVKVNNATHGNELINLSPNNFVTTGVIDGVTWVAGVQNALNYERAQYEAAQVYKELVASGYNCYAICSETPKYQNNTDRECLKALSHTGAYTAQAGHSFMDYLARLGGQDAAPVVWEFVRDENGKIVFQKGKEGNYNYAKTKLRENFFAPVVEDMLFTTSIDTTVEDFIGKNENGNFEFIENAEYINLVVGGNKYTTAQVVETKEGANSSYTFTAPGATEPTFWLDYYYGDGETTERFVWTFGENVSMKNLATLTYKLQLTEKQEEAGEYTVPTNNSATLYPVFSNGQKGDPMLFPVPSVTYSVVPYDVDIVLALGAGIAKYDADHTYKNTYNSIVSLVEPLVTAGINVKLGLVAVEHYDDVAMELTELTSANYTTIIQAGLEAIQKMPAGPTNLHGNIVAAKEMLDADTSVPAANKFFYVFATGRTYNYDNEKGIPTTIVNKLEVGKNTYYYWGHYLWQSQRGRHTSLYMIPDRYNNNFESYWADVEKWVAADGDTYAYSFTDDYDVTDPNWFNDFMAVNSTDLRAHGIAGSRYGWLIPALNNSTEQKAIGSGNNPQNALNYERAQYEAYQAYQAMIESGYNCEALCTESPAYLNDSRYIKEGAGYTGTSTIQLGHSFMNFLNGGKAKVLFTYVFDANGNPIATDFAIENYFADINIDELETSGESLGSSTLSLRNSAANGEVASVEVDAEGDALTYTWYYKNSGSDDYSLSSFKGDTYRAVMSNKYDEQQVYCVVTDQYGNSTTTEVVTLNLD